jgi:uncharacterized membrane protein YfcA
LSIGTSLASSIINLVLSARIHHQNKSVIWPLFWSMAPGVLVGALLLGPVLLVILNSAHLKLIFGIFCILIFLQMFFQKQSDIEKILPHKMILGIFGVAIGAIY